MVAKKAKRAAKKPPASPQRTTRARTPRAAKSIDVPAAPLPVFTHAAPRPRPPPDRASSTVERVRYIADEMAGGRWDGYNSRAPLAEIWGITDSTVRNYSAEAHRLCEFEPQEILERRRSLGAFVAVQRARASRMVSRVTGLPDFGSVLRAAELEAKFIGIDLEPPEKTDGAGVAMRIEIMAEQPESPVMAAPADPTAGPPETAPTGC